MLSSSHESGKSIALFWQNVDQAQDDTVKKAVDLFKLVETATPEQLFFILNQYRYFTVYYISDIAILVSRLNEGKMRSFLADILYDELGCGNHLLAHPYLYDAFLKSLDIPHHGIDNFALKENIQLLNNARNKLIDPKNSAVYGLGLRGMGGECVCQIYLTHLYEHVIKNKYIQERKHQIDWRFWELHIGEHDIAHRENLRKLIGESIVGMHANSVKDLQTGYNDSMSAWADFWTHIQMSALTPEKRRFADTDAAYQIVVPKQAAITQFHLAIGVRSLDVSKKFYCDILGAKEGRSADDHIDLDFYGHHLVIHKMPENAVINPFRAPFHGETVAIPHFGINLDWQSWSDLAQRIQSSAHPFSTPPHVRMADMPGEHATLFVTDPTGNGLEFKAFRNHDEVFNKIFSPGTKAISGFDEMVKRAPW